MVFVGIKYQLTPFLRPYINKGRGIYLWTCQWEKAIKWKTNKKAIIDCNYSRSRIICDQK